MGSVFGSPPPGPGSVERPRSKPKPPPSGRPILLYIHFPFCVSKCRYCAFHSQAYNQVTLAWYLKTLLAEIRLWGQRLSAPRLATVYLGGGTPSLLTTGQLAQVLEALDKHFHLEPGLEMTLEANPASGTISTQGVGYFKSLLGLGVNRLSLGMQSLNDADLGLLGRPHDAVQAVAAYHAARSAGFANISLDLIWALPGQRLKTWLDQLQNVVNLGPEHLSCYGLTIEPDTPLAAMVEKGPESGVELPPESEQAKMFVYGAEFLESVGFLQYEISNFARMGYMSRHNQGYWEGMDYLGLGPSAVSTLGGRRFTNSKYMDEHDAAVRGGFAGAEYETLDPATRLKEMVMLSLRTSKGLDLKKHAELAGFKLTEAHPQLLKALRGKNLIRLNQGRLSLTKTGMAVSNVIIERLALSEPE